MKMELEIMKQYLIWICNFSMGNVRKLRINNELPVGADEGITSEKQSRKKMQKVVK